MSSNSNLPLHLENILSPLQLWTKNAVYMNRQQLFDLEIYANEEQFDMNKDIGDILNINTCKCHICDVNVPNSYIQEHLTSVKHMTFSEIAKQALKRTQGHMTTDMYHKMSKLKLEVKDTYFCANCTIVVNNIDKEKHDKSETHVNFVKNDTLLQHFLDIYGPQERFKGNEDAISLNNVKLEDDQISEVSNETDLNVKMSKPANANFDKANEKQNNSTACMVKNKSYTATKTKTRTNDTEVKNEVANQKITQNLQTINAEAPSTSGTKDLGLKTESYEEHIYDIKHFLDIAKFLHKDTIYPTALSKDTIEIVGANVERVRVPLANFHGYHVTGQAVVCKVCMDIESVDGKKHKWTDAHMKLIMLPLTKQHLRQITDTTMHCVLCNSTHPSSKSNEHTSSTEHQENLEKYRTNQELSQKIKQIAVANCLKWTPEDFSCKLCHFTSTKSNDCINQHVNSYAHKKRLDTFLTQNNILKMTIEEGCYWCGVCQKKVGVHIRPHCVSLEHKKRLADFVKDKPFPISPCF